MVSIAPLVLHVSPNLEYAMDHGKFSKVFMPCLGGGENGVPEETQEKDLPAQVQP